MGGTDKPFEKQRNSEIVYLPGLLTIGVPPIGPEAIVDFKLFKNVLLLGYASS
jgi:hypothetical protein